MPPLIMPFSGKERLPATVMFILILAFSLIAPAAGDDGEWKAIIFDKSSDSYKRAFDLRSGKYAASHQTRILDGDFIIMTGYNPSWVTFRTRDWIKVLFSTGEENDHRVDEKCARLPECVPIHYGEGYVAFFGDRTYTIRLIKGYFEVGGSYAEFAYQPGGTPGPEHKPHEKSTREKAGPNLVKENIQIKSDGNAELAIDPSKGNFHVRIEERETASLSSPPKASNSSGSGEEDRIDSVAVTVKTPPPEDKSSPKFDSLTLTLAAAIGESVITLNRDSLSVREGDEKTYTFRNVRPGTYSATIRFRGKTVTDTIDINKSSTEIELDFEEMDGQEPHRNRPSHIKKNETCESRCGEGLQRPVDRRVPAEPVPGIVRHIYVCVTTPAIENLPAESAVLSVELRGTKHFRRTLEDVPPGVTKTFKFLTFPVGAYEVIVKYSDRAITENVELIDDCTEIEVMFD